MTDKDIWEALKKILDPELGIDIVALGLVYEVKIIGSEVYIKMTLTSAGCPLAGVIDEMIKKEIGGLKGVTKVINEIVWDPPWSPECMSEEARAELGI